MIEVFALLQDKLDFIKPFYSSAAEPFEIDLQKIESHEPPYDRFDPEDGEPPYLSQCLDDYESLNLLGKACLCLVQNAFRKYLDGFIERSSREGLLHEGSRIDLGPVRGNWFKAFQTIFRKHFGINWQASQDFG